MSEAVPEKRAADPGHAENLPTHDESRIAASGTHPEDESAEDLEREKLRLEIAELRRSAWGKPSVIVPVAATLFTLGLSQYLGVFDVERKRVELSTKEAEMRRREVQADLTRLEEEKGALVREKQALEERKEGLGKDLARMEGEVVVLKNTVSELSTAAARAEKDASDARTELAHTRNVLARPDINITGKVLMFEQEAVIYMTNRGRGPADVKKIIPYVDGRPMSEGPTDQPYGPMFDALALHGRWLRWYWATRTLAPGEMTPLLMIEPGQFTEERASDFKAAMRRLGFEVCYCSTFGDCYWATYERPDKTTRSCEE